MGKATASEQQEGRGARARRGPIAALTLAAVATVTVAILLLPTPERLPPSDGLDYRLPTDSERVYFRSGSSPDKGHARFSEAIEAYDRHDTRRVVDLLEHERMDEIQKKPMKLLLASALVWEHRYAEAMQRIGELQVESIPQPYRDRARWILMIALAHAGDREGARKILHELAEGTGLFSERARRQLEAHGDRLSAPATP